MIKNILKNLNIIVNIAKLSISNKYVARQKNCIPLIQNIDPDAPDRAKRRPGFVTGPSSSHNQPPPPINPKTHLPAVLPQTQRAPVSKVEHGMRLIPAPAQKD